MLSGGTQRRALPRHQSEEIEILNISFPRMGIEHKTCRVFSHTLCPLRHDWPHSNIILYVTFYLTPTWRSFKILQW